MTRHPYSAEFHKILQEMGELHDKKQADYGEDYNPFANVCASTQFGIEPVLGALLRMGDKWQRIKKWATRRSLSNESIEDSLLDNAVYSIIALVLLREAQSKLDQPDLFRKSPME